MITIRALAGLLLLIYIVSDFMPVANALTCLDCDKSKCIPPEGCKHGNVGDLCNCCERCAKGPGEECGGLWTQDGKCGIGLHCLLPGFNQKKGKCVPAAEAAEILNITTVL